MTHESTLVANQKQNTADVLRARNRHERIASLTSGIAAVDGGAIVSTSLPGLKLQVDLEETRANSVTVPIHIDAENTVWTSASDIGDEESLRTLLRRYANSTLSVATHPDSAHGALVEVMDIAQSCGVKTVTRFGSSRNRFLQNDEFAAARQQRRGLEVLHQAANAGIVDAAILNQISDGLASSDRSIRYAARIALEHRAMNAWTDWAGNLRDPNAVIGSVIARARSHERVNMGDKDSIDSPIPDWSNSSVTIDVNRSAITSEVLERLASLDTRSLSVQQQIDVLRAITLTFVRIAPPNADEREKIIRRVEGMLPAKSPELNSLLAQLVVYLQAPFAAEKLVPMMLDAPTQEEQIDLASSLRHLKVGWLPRLQDAYFGWFVRASTYRGGATFALYIDNIKNDAVANLNAEDRQRLQPLLDQKPESDAPVFTAAPRSFVKEWTMQELVPLVQAGLKNRDFDHGRKMFAAASCFACHRFDNQGGSVGPDLTALSGRFSSRDLLESIVEPSKVISDQYGSVNIVTLDGKIISGRIINLAGDSFRIQTNMLDPGTLV
ncbi:MAG: c-type cytochrome, partial [Planctomycetaceae bacterium]|nr:c-type cytochrome [Planctomycetaceae bacterium]